MKKGTILTLALMMLTLSGCCGTICSVTGQRNKAEPSQTEQKPKN